MELMYTAHVPAGDGPFPTIVALHGWGANAHDLLGLAPILHGGEALVLCPQGGIQIPIQEGIVGYGWFPLSGGGEPDPREIERAAASLRGFLDEVVEKYPVDRRKLVLAGFSQGGFMAYELALKDPARFAGLLAMSSWLPGDLAAATAATPEHANLPALVVHGTEDPMIPVERGQESRDALIALGLPTAYREYKMGHGIGPEALREIVGWLEEKVLSPILLV